MKETRFLGFVCFTTVLLSSSFAQSSGKDALKALSDFNDKWTISTNSETDYAKSADFSVKLTKWTRIKAAAALAKLDVSKVDPSDSYNWAQVAAMAEDNKLVVAFTGKYLATNPNDKDAFAARILRTSSLSALGYGQKVAEEVARLKPSNADQYSDFASYTIGIYADAIKANVGLETALAALDQVGVNPIPFEPLKATQDHFAEWRKWYPASKSDVQIRKEMVAYYKEANESNEANILQKRAELIGMGGRREEGLSLIDNYLKNHKVNKSLRTSLEYSRTQISAFGSSAPDFSTKMFDGAELKLSDLRGQIVVIDFWATWCGPCQLAMPHFEKIYELAKDQGVKFLGLNVWDTKEAYEKWVPSHRDRFKFPVAIDTTSRESGKDIAGKLYGVSGIPTTVVIDREGHVAGFFTGYLGEVDSRLEKCLEGLGIKVDG